MMKRVTCKPLPWALVLAAFLSAVGSASEHTRHASQPSRTAWIREQVSRSSADFVSPDPAIVKVLLMTPSGAVPGSGSGRVLECSGAVISPSKVITAAHCLIDARGEWIPGRLLVVPGLDGWRREPWGRFEVTSAVEEGFDYETGANDIAVLTVGRNALGERIGDLTGWFERSRERPGRDVQGYAGSVGWQHHESCASLRYREKTIEHDCFTPKGTSGSPVFFVDESTGATWIVAINSRVQDGLSVATRLRGAMWDFVEAEVLSDP